jgi:hypothetical protein
MQPRVARAHFELISAFLIALDYGASLPVERELERGVLVRYLLPNMSFLRTYSDE